MDECFIEQLVWWIDKFITACGDVKLPSEKEKHPQGHFAQPCFGYNHEMGAGNQAGKAIFYFFLAGLIIFPRSCIDSIFTAAMRKRSTSYWAAERCSC